MADAIQGTGVWSIGNNWPWPQVFFLEYYTLILAIKDGTTNLYLYEAYCSTTNVWTATEIQNLGAVANVKYVTVADFNKFYVLTTYARSGNTITIDAWEKTVGADEVSALPSTNSPVYACATNFNGQAIIGGIVHGDDSSFSDMAYNTVAWSEIGKFDFRIGEVEVTPGGPKRFNRTSGYRHMPWGEYGKGIVYRVAKLGGGVIAYGDGGIALLEPKSSPASTYSMMHLSGEGISQGAAMDGDDKVHFWIGEKNELFMCDSSYKITKLGYKEFLEDLSGIVKLSYSPGRKRLYISDGSTGYVLTEHGLYSTDQLCSSIGSYRGTLCGFFIDGGDAEIRLTTDTLDFNARGFKTLERVGVGGRYYNTDGDDLSVRVQWKADYQDQNFSDDPGWKILNNRGMAYPVVSGNEFRVRLKGTTYVDSEFDISYIKMLVKYTDRHSVYAEKQQI